MKIYIADTQLIENFNIEFYKLIKPIHTRVTRRGRVTTTSWFEVRQINGTMQSALFVDEAQEIRFHLESSIVDYLELLQAEFQNEIDESGVEIWNERTEIESFYDTTLKGALGTSLDVFPLAWIDSLITEQEYLDLIEQN